jgi:hypothetical protein
MIRVSSLRIFIPVIAVLFVAGCGDDSTSPAGEDTGILQVELVMVGPSSDPDGCTVALDGGDAKSIFGGESETFSDVVQGSHIVQLADLAAGCRVSDNPRVVTVEAGETTETRFEVDCSDGPTTGPDPLQVLLAGGTYEKVEPEETVLSSTAMEEEREDGFWSCTVERRSAVTAPDDYATFNPNAEIIYPGSMLQGATLVNATPEPIVVPRAGGTVVINLLNGSSGVAQSVDEVKQSTIVQAVNDILAANTGIVPARFTYNSSEVQSREQMALSLGVNVSTLSVDFNSKMSFSMDQQYNRFLVQMNQSFYTVSFDLPYSIDQLIAPGVTGEQLEPYVGPGNPATYISSVTYGRNFFLLIESTSSVMDMKASIQASYDALVVDGSMDLNATYVRDLSNVNIKVFALGGDQSLATATFNGDFEAIGDFLTEGADIRTGVPLSYVVRNVADNSIVNVKVATDYDVKTCIPMMTEQLYSGFADHEEGWTTFDNGNYQAVRATPGDCLGGMGGCLYTIDYPGVGVVYFRAPHEWIDGKDWSSFYNGLLEFYMHLDFSDASGWVTGAPNVIIDSPDGRLTFTLPLVEAVVPVVQGWTRLAIDLGEGGTTWGAALAKWQINGADATQAQIEAVLSNVIDFRIRADLIYGTDVTWLDEVRIMGPDAVGMP